MKARDLMIPASDCARVAEDRTIYDAVVMLEAWRRRCQSEYRPRLVLVYDKDFKIIGSAGHAGMLRALSDAPADLSGEPSAASSSHDTTLPPFPPELTTAWGKVLTRLHTAAHYVRVKEAMVHYEETQYIEDDTPMEVVFRRLVSGPYESLVVVSGRATIGIVRLSDVFSKVCKEISRSGMK